MWQTLKDFKRSFDHIEWPNFWFISLSPIVAIVGTIWVIARGGPHPATWLLTLVMLGLTGIGITAGYHRLFTHRTFRAHWSVRLLLLLFGGAAFEASAREWCCAHRKHHRHVDHEGDPYNIRKGFWHAHVGWVILKSDQSDESGIKDLKRDPLILWQHRWYVPLAVLVSFVMPAGIAALWGDVWGGIFIAGFARVVLNLQLTFLINSYCHYFGTQTYSEENSARDSWIISLFTYGEGFHNFHHAFEADYRNGVRYFHWDPAKWLIMFLSWFGLTSNLHRESAERILAARLAMQERRARVALSRQRVDLHAEWERLLVAGRSRLECLQRTLLERQAEYRHLKRAHLATMRDRIDELRVDIQSKKREFKLLKQQWQDLCRAASRTIPVTA
jgi:stearoyl-CoA desaturase (Delta-9 desaturase)